MYFNVDCHVSMPMQRPDLLCELKRLREIYDCSVLFFFNSFSSVIPAGLYLHFVVTRYYVSRNYSVKRFMQPVVSLNLANG